MEGVQRTSATILKAEKLRVSSSIYLDRTTSPHTDIRSSSWRVKVGQYFSFAIYSGRYSSRKLVRVVSKSPRNPKPWNKPTRLCSLSAVFLVHDFYLPNTLALTPHPLVDWFKLWYRPIFEARRFSLDRILTVVSYLESGCCGPYLLVYMSQFRTPRLTSVTNTGALHVYGFSACRTKIFPKYFTGLGQCLSLLMNARDHLR